MTTELCEQHLERYNAAIELDRYADARKYAELALAEGPDNPDCHVALGRVCLLQEQPLEALEFFKEALRLDPDDYICMYLTARALMAQKPVARLEPAERIAGELVAQHPDWVLSHELLGDLAASREHKIKAAEHYEAGLKLEPHRAVLLRSYADVLEPVEAIPVYRKSLSIEPNSPATLNNLGVALNKIGDARGAADVFRQAVQLDPSLEVAKSNSYDTLSGLKSVAGVGLFGGFAFLKFFKFAWFARAGFRVNRSMGVGALILVLAVGLVWWYLQHQKAQRDAKWQTMDDGLSPELESFYQQLEKDKAKGLLR